MKVNYHTHSKRCGHAQGSEEEYILSALASDVKILGFSDHAPFPDKDYGYRMQYSDFLPYIEILETLTKKYQNDIILFKGLEIEYLPEYLDYYKSLLTEYRMDYLLLGQHFFYTRNNEFTNITQIHSSEYCIDYALSISEALDTKLFAMVAHPDIYMMNMMAWDEHCETTADIIIEAALRNDVILEFNANGLRREPKEYTDGVRHPYPHNRFWTKAKKAGVRCIIGADCHNPSQVWDETVEKSYDLIREIGLEPELNPFHATIKTR